MAKAKRTWRPSSKAMGALRLAGSLNRLRMNSMTRTRTQGRRYGAGTPVTNQHDVARLYTKKRMPARRRKAWKTFSRKTNAVLNAQLSTSQFTRRENPYLVAPPAGMGYVSQQMFSANGTAAFTGGPTQSGTGDCQDMGDYFNYLNTSGTGGITRAAKYRITSCCMDTTITNTLASTAILEVYEWRAKRIVNNIPGVVDNPEAYYVQSFTDLANAAPYSVGADSYGTTPFQAKLWCQRFTIVKKTRIQLGGFQTTCLQMKDNRPKVVTLRDFSDMFANKYTRGYFLQVMGSPQDNALQPTGPAVLRVLTTRTYAWKRIDNTLAYTANVPV